MRTTLNIDDRLLTEVVNETGETDKGRAVNKAMEEFIRRRKIERLISLARAGKIRFEGDWQERHSREMELEKEHRWRDE
jgi:Arc/MetJ family transcription regulator